MWVAWEDMVCIPDGFGVMLNAFRVRTWYTASALATYIMEIS